MAPLNPPPPALTLEEAVQLENTLVSDKRFADRQFRGADLATFLEKHSVKYEGKSAVQVGQALMEHRLLHHISDDSEFDLDGEFRLISQETSVTQTRHAAFNESVKNAVFHGKIMFETKHLFGLLNSFAPAYGILTSKTLYIFKRLSAASDPITEYPVSQMSQVKECIDCKADWYCLSIKMKQGYSVTICADHSKRQEGWMSALTNLGLDFAKIYDEGSSGVGNMTSLFELSARRLNSKEVVPFSTFKETFAWW